MTIQTHFDDTIVVEVVNSVTHITVWNEDEGSVELALDSNDLWKLGLALSVASQTTERRPKA